MRQISEVVVVSLILTGVAACSGSDQTEQAIKAVESQSGIHQSSKQDILTYIDWDTAPEKVYQPRLPEGVEINHDGNVVVQIVVDTNGIVEMASIERSSGHSYLDTLSLSHALKTVWKPAIKNGVLVKSKMSRPYLWRKRPSVLPN